VSRAARWGALAVCVLVLGACGGDDEGGGGEEEGGARAGESVELELVEGEVQVKEPGAQGFEALADAAEVAVGTEVDASKGVVLMTSATSDGATQSGEFSEGGFEVIQKPGSSVVTLALRGGDFSKCKTKAARRDRSTVGGPEVRRLFVDADGEFRTEGRFAAAAIRGTKFTAVDACFGTLTEVEEGRVLVSDLTADREIDLDSGEEYWAAQRR
jgi:hypothetical protein